VTAVVLSVLGLALVDSVNPAVIGFTLFLLLRAEGPGRPGEGVRPRSRVVPVLVYLSAVAGTYLALGVTVMVGLGAISDRLGAVLQSSAAYAVTGVCGLTMFGWSWVDSSRDKKHPHRHETTRSRLPTSDNLVPIVSLGVVVPLLEFTTALPLLAAVGLMTTNGLAPAFWLPLLAVYVLVMVLPELLLVTVFALLSEGTRARLERLRQRLAGNARRTVQWIVAIVGFLLARDAAFHFAIEFGWYVPNTRS
jgi:cytochrome c biogenesis protein CcdA